MREQSDMMAAAITPLNSGFKELCDHFKKDKDKDAGRSRRGRSRSRSRERSKRRRRSSRSSSGSRSRSPRPHRRPRLSSSMDAEQFKLLQEGINALTAAQKDLKADNERFKAEISAKMEMQLAASRSTINTPPPPPSSAASNVGTASAAAARNARMAAMRETADFVKNLPSSTPAKKAALKDRLVSVHGLSEQDVRDIGADIPSLVAAVMQYAAM